MNEGFVALVLFCGLTYGMYRMVEKAEQGMERERVEKAVNTERLLKALETISENTRVVIAKQETA